MGNRLPFTSPASSLEVESKGNKRKECSSPPLSGCQFSRRKQQKTPDILKGLGPTIDLDDVKPTLYGSSSDLPILVVDSNDQQQLDPKNDPSGTSVDLPIIIIDPDDTNSINRHQKDPSPKAALTGKYCVENQPKESAELPIIVVDSDVNIGIQEDSSHALIETADELPQTTLTRSDAEEVELSKEENEGAYKSTSNSLQFYLIRVGGSRDVSGLKLGNTQNASSANAVDDSFGRIDSEKENFPLNAPTNDCAATAVDDEIAKNDNHQIDVKDNSLDASDGTSDERVCKKFKELRELNSPSYCNIQLQETVCSDMEDTSQVSVEDDLCEIWKEMEFGLECTKDCLTNHAAISDPMEEYTECDHSVILKDDLGYVCRVCGVIQQSIDTIFDIQFYKGKRSTRTKEPSDTNNTESTNAEPCVIPSNDFTVTEISAHEKHRKLMKPHQVEGFNFLCSNLITDSPGGCILAHAPGSGKTFMIISFIQSFLARYPDSRPLIVLPKGILQTWKNEFLKWQVEEIPLYDFYTSKAENRSQQLSVLKKWAVKKSILFLGYKQLSVIICDSSASEISSKCKHILQEVPSILILDEGHTPRNEETDLLRSLSSVRTPRKVVLSGTLYQNHVNEVFNILNLVRPKFLKLPNSKMIVNRIMSRVKILRSGKKHLKCGLNSGFYESVEYTLQKDEDFKRRKAVIGDLREMTRNVLHYYKGDFLDELPGLVDYTVVLNLSPKQKNEVRMLRKLNLFKRNSLGSGIYVHPVLKSLSQVNSAMIDGKIDEVLDGLDVNEGVKAKFFLNMLGLCESSREKLLVFSQYIVPLKLLERLTAKVKGWRVGREVFMITGDTNVEERERCMEQFNGSEKARVFFGSIKACGEGISLVGASRVIIMDVHLNPSVTRQAIGRAFRPGQKKKVFTYRLIAGDSPEEEDSLTCCRKELIAKMWFEWNEYSGTQDFEMKAVDPEESEDAFFQCPGLIQDLNVLYKR